MFSFLTGLLSSNLVKRSINHWTVGGASVVIMGFVQLGILPKEAIETTTGMSDKQLTPWIIIVLGVWIVTHIHIVSFFKWLRDRKVNNANSELTVDQLKLQDLQLKQKIRSINANNK